MVVEVEGTGSRVLKWGLSEALAKRSATAVSGKDARQLKDEKQPRYVSGCARKNK